MEWCYQGLGLGEEQRTILDGYGVAVLQDEESSEDDGGDGCTAVLVY